MKINHAMSISEINRFVFNKTKHENKKLFCRYCYWIILAKT